MSEERIAFEQWLGIKPCGAAHDLAWAAWQARASLPTQPAAQATPPQQAAGEPFGQVTVRRLSQRHANHVDQYQFYPAGQSPYLDNVDECHTVYTHPAPGVPEVIDEDQLHTIERAADLLEHYAAFINEVKPDDIERHPYVPEIELTASDLRLFAAAQKGENHG